jgi:hypothetical protein
MAMLLSMRVLTWGSGPIEQPLARCGQLYVRDSIRDASLSPAIVQAVHAQCESDMRGRCGRCQRLGDQRWHKHHRHPDQQLQPEPWSGMLRDLLVC